MRAFSSCEARSSRRTTESVYRYTPATKPPSAPATAQLGSTCLPAAKSIPVGCANDTSMWGRVPAAGGDWAPRWILLLLERCRATAARCGLLTARFFRGRR